MPSGFRGLAMISLPELQQRFSQAMLNPQSTVLAGLIRENGLSGERRARVYRNNIAHSLSRALHAAYPVVCRLVGDRFFDHAALCYLRGHLPRSGNLHDFGATFPRFLQGFEPAQALPYLPDVARLEWARQTVYHALGVNPLALEQLQAVPPASYPALRFQLNPASRLLASSYPVLRIWEVNQPSYQGETRVDLGMGGVKLLVIRRGLAIAMHALRPGEYICLWRLAAGSSLGDAYERTAEEEPAFDLAAFLKRHVLGQTLAGICVNIPKPNYPSF
ncbi:MAG: DNA-binding domain-containing protein [Gammaproteobacteria bacterium]